MVPARVLVACQLAAALTIAGALVDCGGDSNPPTTAPTPAITVSSVSVAGTAPAIGASAQFSATATLSNGTTQTITSQAGWSSSNAAVATVTSSGVVTAVSAGDVEISATYQNVAGRTRITILRSEAPTHALTGIISDMTSHAGIEGARLEVLTGVNAGKTATTDRTGTYVFRDLIADSFRLRASASEYNAGEQGVTVPNNLRADFELLRTGGPCAYTMSPSWLTVTAAGGTFTSVATRNTPSGCSWNASTSDPWITLTGATSGGSPGLITFTVAPTTTIGRFGQITVGWSGGSAPIWVNQAFPRDGCPASRTVTLTAPPQEIALYNIGRECALGLTGTATFDVSWIRLRSTHGGGQYLDLVIDSNGIPGTPRTGHMTLRDGTVVYSRFTFNQAAFPVVP